ncbi:substrate-binding domain-containing protein [Amycolatopsis rhabdoformis]|uniref:Substrate-binding domain-containing protein n=1 Tax=Amycolatopsis rhabdoformis TaxID=1448059 RepID=A0ABZ1ICW8_9PSEU|nr:substrate-binding domain-containing protein [Amycolatopsis rhabdoformis]WSE32247.1 substrate-binding domain-containing protein [Amycolatopsis rhabdoformis]
MTATAACTGSTDAAPAATAETAACRKQADEFLAPYTRPAETLPPQLTALARRPEPGGSVIQISNGSLPQDVTTANATVAAAHTIGWAGKVLITDGSVEDLNAKWQQAIAEHPTAIIGSTSSDPIRTALSSARRAGILTALNAASDPPDDRTGPDVVNNGSTEYAHLGEVNAYTVLRDAGCVPTGVVVVSLQFPVLQAEADKFKETLLAHCPKCEVTVKTLQNGDVGTPAATGSIVSTLQADPSTKYVYALIGSLGVGVPAALQAAGMTDVKVFGAQPDSTAVQAVVSGSAAWWLSQENSEIAGWFLLDGVLRAKESGKPHNEVASTPTILTRDTVPADAQDPPIHPADYVALFTRLWRVG